ncbi:MAG: V-type ATP synthase subunit E [Candidatus Brocadiales bacterium]
MQEESKEGLLKTMEKEALEERQKLEEASRKQVQEIKETAEKEVARLRQKAFESVDERLRLERSRRLARAEQEARSSLLLARQNIIDNVLAEVEDIVLKSRQDEDLYPALLRKTLQEALEELEGEVVLKVHPSDRALCEEIMRGRGRNYKIEEDGNISGGVILKNPNGLISVHNTLQSRAKKAREMAIAEVARVLFGGEKGS